MGSALAFFLIVSPDQKKNNQTLGALSDFVYPVKTVSFFYFTGAVQHIQAGTSKAGIVKAFERFKNGFRKEGKIPELWDGKAANRIVDKLIIT